MRESEPRSVEGGTSSSGDHDFIDDTLEGIISEGTSSDSESALDAQPKRAKSRRLKVVEERLFEHSDSQSSATATGTIGSSATGARRDRVIKSGTQE